MPHSGDVVGWLLNGEDRANLLQRIAPAYSRVVAHHVTLKAEAAEDERAPAAQDAAIIGPLIEGEHKAQGRRCKDRARPRSRTSRVMARREVGRNGGGPCPTASPDRRSPVQHPIPEARRPRHHRS